uniref:Phosphoglycerate mutase-like protein n=1 Tax=Physcomitrium patens TaxID=3218 RepID=A0A7I4B4G4_PHYPA
MAVPWQASSLALMRDIPTALVVGFRGARDNGAKVDSRCLERDSFVMRSGSQRQESTLREGSAEENMTHSLENWRVEMVDGMKWAFNFALTSICCYGVAAAVSTPDIETWRIRGSPFFDVPDVLNVGTPSAHASGLLQMPPVRLVNRGLSEEGKKQTIQAAKSLRALGACDDSCWIWPSITQRAYQTAEIIAYVNNINRSRIVPEYSFLDARGLGAYEGKGLAEVNEVYDTIDAISANLRPPPFTDGTVNESVRDVFVRVTQLMSILETQYFNETIVIVAPDSDNLSVLEAGLTGLDLRRHRQLAYTPGEVRYVDANRLPAPRQAVSGYVKCTAKPPNC